MLEELKGRRRALIAAAAGAALGAAGLYLLRGAAPERAARTRPLARVEGRVGGRVEMVGGQAAQAATSDRQVVVYAYALDGPRQPLAVLRRPASQLPFEFTLDDSLAPNPAFRLSQAPRLVVGARLGVGDAATAQPADWVAPSQTVALDTQGLRLVLHPPGPSR